ARESREAGGRPHRRGRLRRRPRPRPAGASCDRRADALELNGQRGAVGRELFPIGQQRGRRHLFARGRLPRTAVERYATLRDPYVVSGIDWYTARAAGVVAYALLTGGVLLGVLLAGRARLLPRWPAFAVTDVHRFVALLTAAFVLLHVYMLLVDRYVHTSLVAV